MVVAIDGPAGAGKSTVAKKVAEKIGALYLDTGAMYRAFTLYVLKNEVSLDNLTMIKHTLDNFELSITEDKVSVNGDDVTTAIREADVTANVSYISSLGFVRKKMVELQREMGKNKAIVVEGRDIGTVVFPDTPYKFYLDADIEERAKRRLNDEKIQKNVKNILQIKQTIKNRDIYDSSRTISPLKKADDAVYIDSTDKTVEEVCTFIINSIHEKTARSSWT
ncbi:MAG: (d)CMP kinase [Spirochaetota bacterium]|nr:MAG: (d)CMP kinase [Spirochaetota bacterium]